VPTAAPATAPKTGIVEFGQQKQSLQSDEWFRE
jgi:hypothetical protein